ncbi:MAG TPA: YhcH/YjgK/YiaL family protein [Ferruginibacter sp.]|nr:YhcH/YjgK/YiaL family protein [Ferruginibacter sp.]HMP20498.1 YhcH/YjgK/YiaL family protein [Ferruginibacter sp.]
MIVDSLQNAQRYISLHPSFAKAFEFVNSLNLETLEAGKFEIDGKALHASVSAKDGVPAGDAKYEAHDNYIDIQVCPSGTEQIGWSPREKCTDIKIPYNAEKDVTIYNVTQPDTYIQLNPGQFAIFYPEDVHGPMIGTGPVKKLVVKVKL